MTRQIASSNNYYKSDGYAIVNKVGRGLCWAALLFASGDIWPTVKIGFTFRFTQLCILTAGTLLISKKYQSLRTVVGFRWLYAFILTVVLELPFSVYPLRSIGYTFWAITDVLIILVFVEYFENLEDIERLLKWFTTSFIVLAIFGCVQFLFGLTGHSLFTTEWWIPGLLPRVNGLSYEPSYYATYLIAGWVYSAYLLESRMKVSSHRLQLTCLLTTTVALVLCTSRMGWFMMVLWVVFRLSRAAFLGVVSGALNKATFRKAVIALLAICTALVVVSIHQSDVENSLTDVSFLAQGLGMFGESSHSARPRIDRFMATWRVFQRHPIFGVGIGALPVEIARQSDEGILNLREAKMHQGMSIFLELLASTGVVGGAMVIGFAVAVIRELKWIKRHCRHSRRIHLVGVGWGIVWMLGILQFNQNFLRIYLFTDLGVFLACISVLRNCRDATNYLEYSRRPATNFGETQVPNV